MSDANAVGTAVGGCANGYREHVIAGALELKEHDGKGLPEGRTSNLAKRIMRIAGIEILLGVLVVLLRLEQEENRVEAEYDVLMTRLSDPADRQTIQHDAAIEQPYTSVTEAPLEAGKSSPR